MRLLRQASDLSQVELAQRLGMDGNGQISKLENGRVVAEQATVAAIAAALDCTPDYLMRPRADVLSTRPWLRAYADAPSKAVDYILADNTLNYELIMAVELKRIPERIPRFDGDVNDEHAIEEFAEEVRVAAEVGEGAAVGNAIRAAERLGCVVLPLSDELGRHLGMSHFIDGTPYIRVSRARPNVPGDRQRFTVAHELGHLSLHADTRPPETADDARRIEAQAHRFAGAFLTPRYALLEDLEAQGGRVTLTTLSQLKSNWGVAIKMLVVRLKQLGVIGDEQSTSLYKQISKRGWNTGEPVPVSNEGAIWLDRTLRQKWATPDAAKAVSDHYGLGASHVRRWLSWELSDESHTGAVLALVDRAMLTQKPRRNRVGESARGPAFPTGGIAGVTALRPRSQ